MARGPIGFCSWMLPYAVIRSSGKFSDSDLLEGKEWNYDIAESTFINEELCDVTSIAPWGSELWVEWLAEVRKTDPTQRFHWLWLRRIGEGKWVVLASKLGGEPSRLEGKLAAEELPYWPLEARDCIGWHTTPRAPPFGFLDEAHGEGGALVRWSLGPCPAVGAIISAHGSSLRTYAVRLRSSSMSGGDSSSSVANVLDSTSGTSRKIGSHVPLGCECGEFNFYLNKVEDYLSTLDFSSYLYNTTLSIIHEVDTVLPICGAAALAAWALASLFVPERVASRQLDQEYPNIGSACPETPMYGHLPQATFVHAIGADAFRKMPLTYCEMFLLRLRATFFYAQEGSLFMDLRSAQNGYAHIAIRVGDSLSSSLLREMVRKECGPHYLALAALFFAMRFVDLYPQLCKRMQARAKRLLQQDFNEAIVLPEGMMEALEITAVRLNRSMSWLKGAAEAQLPSPPFTPRGKVDLWASGISCFAEGRQDVILERIFSEIGFSSRRFVEVGVGNGEQCNSRYFRVRYGFSGLMLDAFGRNPMVNLHRELVTPNNFDGLVRDYGVWGPLDLLSIDVDGADFYIWQQTELQPRVVVIEHNGPPLMDRVLRYHPLMGRLCHNITPGYPERFAGATVAALFALGRAKGYHLVHVSLENAFFVESSALPQNHRFAYVDDVKMLVALERRHGFDPLLEARPEAINSTDFFLQAEDICAGRVGDTALHVSHATAAAALCKQGIAKTRSEL